MLFRPCNMFRTLTSALPAVCAQYGCCLQFLNFVLSRCVAQVLCEWFWDGSSRHYYYRYLFFWISIVRSLSVAVMPEVTVRTAQIWLNMGSKSRLRYCRHGILWACLFRRLYTRMCSASRIKADGLQNEINYTIIIIIIIIIVWKQTWYQ